jgi:hypothetical protein
MMRAATTLFMLALAVSGDAIAADAAVTLGDARVRYDDTRWRPLPSEGSVRFEPTGEAARKLDPVELHVAGDDAPCTTLAQRAFAFGHYDASEIISTPVVVGGVAAERFAAHTGCRNATPLGEVVCVRFERRAYLMSALQAGCGGRNLFSGTDPLTEIATGITFTPR